jgi:hypothetical protein
VARRDQRRRTVAVAWLLGELDGTVEVPREWVCAALGLDADALADVVRRILGEEDGAGSPRRNERA